MTAENITSPELGNTRVVSTYQIGRMESQLLQLESLLYAIKTLDNGDEHVTKTLAELGESVANDVVNCLRELKKPVELTQAA